MLLRYTLGLEEEAKAVEAAVDATLASGARTADIASRGSGFISTTEFTQSILGNL